MHRNVAGLEREKKIYGGKNKPGTWLCNLATQLHAPQAYLLAPRTSVPRVLLDPAL